MQELISWHDGTLFINSWLIIGLVFAIAVAYFFAQIFDDRRNK